MAMRIVCTQCDSGLNVSETLKGKTIRCPKCKELTRVPGGQAKSTVMPSRPTKPAARDGDDTPSPTKLGGFKPANGKPVKKTMLSRTDAEEGFTDRKKTPPVPAPMARKPKKTQPARDIDDEMDDRPARKTPSRRDDDDDDRPVRKGSKASSRRHDEDDYDDAPTPRREGGKSQKSGSPMIWIGVGVGGLVLIGGIVLAFVLLKGPSDEKQVAQNPALVVAPPMPMPMPGDAKLPNPVTPPKETDLKLPKEKIADTPIQKEDPGTKETAPQATPIPPGPTPNDIETATTKKVKKATAYLRVKSGDNQSWEGSGFFGVEKGIVFTNAHVVGMLNAGAAAPKEIEVVVNSGQKNDEFKLSGIVLGVDRDNDLAVVRVTGDLARCPPPLPVELEESSLTELQQVYIFGFPLGASIGKEITASKSSVSSFRRDVDGSLFQIQVNGGMHPGNSGGPVVDARGVVVGVAVAGITGTQINFAVPSEKIQGMLHGRVQEANLGAPYKDNQAVKLPLKLTCLDPLQRIREVSLEVWSGPSAGSRPASFKAPATLPGDGAKQSISLKYQLGNASHDLVLPSVNLPPGHAYWIQPVLVTTSGVKHWASATTFEPANSPPLERVPVNLTFKTTPAQRTLNLKSKFEVKVKDKVVDADYVTANMLELLETPAPPNINIRLVVGKGEFSMHDGIKLIKRNVQAQNLALRRIYSFDADANGKLVRFTFPNFKLKDFIMQMEAEEMSGLLNTSYQAVCLSVPNRQVAPLETWPTKITLIVGSGKKKTPLDLVMTCRYEGSRQADGKNLAMLSLTGQLESRKPTPGAARPKDRITGHGLFDVEGGYFTKVNISLRTEGDAQGILYTRVMEFDVARVPGNLDNIPIPSANPPPTPPDVPVAKGNVIFDQQGSLQVKIVQTGKGPPKIIGATQRSYSVNLTAGKTYIIDLKAPPGSTLDPVLRIEQGGKLLAEDDDGGGFPNARIVFKAPSTGPYQLVATSFKGSQGTFHLIVTEVGGAPGPNPGPNPAPTQPKSEVNNNPDPKEGAPPKGWAVLFKSDDPSLWNTNSPGGTQFAVPVRTAHSTVRFLRLKRMDTGEALIVPITHQQLAVQPRPFPKQGHGWNGTANFSFGGRHLGIYQAPSQYPVPKAEIVVLQDGPINNCRGSGFGHKAYVDDAQYYSWKGKEIPKTLFEIAVTADPLTSNENPLLLTAAETPGGDLGNADGATRILGGAFDPQFKDEAPANGLLIGFEFGLGKWINNDNIKAIRPIYRVAKDEEVKGKQYGTKLERVVTVKAKAGYAVGSVAVNAGLWIDCVIVTFLRMADGKLDPSDSYLSDPVGNRGANPIILGGDGSLVIGIVGRSNQSDCGGMGLLLKKNPAATANSQPVPQPQPTPSVAGKTTVDLIAKFDATKDVIHGKWAVVNNVLQCNHMHLRPRVQIPYQPPEEYDFTVAFSQVKPRNGISLIMPNLKNGKSFFWNVSGNRGEVHLSATPPKREKVPDMAIPNKTYTATVQVRQGGVMCLLDGKVVMEHKTDFSDLAADNWHEIRDKSFVGLACDDPTVFHYAQIVEITGTGKAAR